LKATDEGKERLAEYKSSLHEAAEMGAASIHEVMEEHLGLSPMNIGVAPTEWLKLGRSPVANGNRQHTAKMMECVDLLERKELQNYKFNRELNLYDRRANMTAHCFPRKCSDYCWREKVIDVPYIPVEHQ